MKPSEINAQTVLGFLRLDGEPDDVSPDTLLAAAKSYIMSYTGLDEAEMDLHEEISIAILVLCSDLYDNRQTAVESDKVNRTVWSILDLHSANLL